MRPNALYCQQCGAPLPVNASASSEPPHDATATTSTKPTLNPSLDDRSVLPARAGATAPLLAPSPPPPAPIARPQPTALPTRHRPEAIRGGLVAAVVIAFMILGVALVVSQDRSSSNAMNVASDGRSGSEGSENGSSPDSRQTDDSDVSGSGADSDGSTDSTDGPPPSVPPSPSPAPQGSWAALFVSDPGITVAQNVQGQLQPSIARSVDVFHSDTYASLRPGYWVAGVRGLSSAQDAIGVCRSLGRMDSSLCYARRLLNGPGISWDDPAGSGQTNNDYVVYPD